MGIRKPGGLAHASRLAVLAALVATIGAAGTAPQTAGASSNRISWAGGSWYLQGTNYPWHGYGTDFGANAWGVSGVHTTASYNAIDADFAAMAAEGVHSTRWWVFSDGRAGITFDSAGMPSGIDSNVFPDLDAAVQIAAKHNIYLDLVLLDFTWMQDPQTSSGVQLGGHANVINTTTGQQDLINNVFVPVFKRYGSNPMVVSWEVMNEPEWAITDDGSVHTNISQPSSLANFQAFTSAVANAVHTNTKSYVTVGEAAMKWASQWKGLGLDYYEIHYYDWMNPFPNTNLYGATASSLGLDAPVVVGEFPAANSTTANMQQYLDTWFNNGYAGAWSWSYGGVDANGAPSSSVMLPWAVAHASSIVVAPSSGVPTYDHIFTILMENHSYAEVIGQPYIASLAAQGATAGNYSATDHPSLPNYAELTSGQSFPNASSDCDPSASCQSTARNIVDSVTSAGLSWHAYEESMGSACGMASSYPYAARHNPYVYYTDIAPASCQANDVDFSNLANDLKSPTTLASYVFITPNVLNDMHDGTVQQGDTWLSNNVPAILQSAAFTQQHSLLVVVWDEDDYSQSNQVAWVAVGYGVKKNYVSSVSYNHYSFLRTIEASWGLPTLTTTDGGASPMSDVFGSTNVTPLAATAGANPTSGHAPLTVSLTGSASGGVAPYGYSWNFGDGTAPSTAQNPTHLYASAGTYTATLAVSDSGGHNATVNAPAVTVSLAPLTATASALPSAGDLPLTVAFTGTGAGGLPPLAYTWAFGDGTVGSGATASHTYSAAGSYTATVTVTDASSQSQTAQVTVVVSPALSASAGASPLVVDVGDAVSFSGTGVGGLAPFSYSWSFADGSAASTVQNPSHAYSSAAQYTATLTVSDGNGVKTNASVLVTVHALPTVSASGSPSAGDAPVTVSLNTTASGGTLPYAYSWDFGDGSAASTLPNPSHLYAAAGSYTATVTVSDGLGHSASATVAVSVSAALSAGASASPTSGQAPLTVNLSAMPTGGRAPYTYSWNFGDATPASTAQNPTHSYSGPGTFVATVIITDANGATAGGNAPSITVTPAPLAASATATKTYGDDPMLTTLTGYASGGTAPFRYAWDLGDGASSSQQSFAHSFGAGSFIVSLTITDSAGRTATATLHVIVYPALTGSVTAAPTSGIAPLSVTFAATASGGYAPYTFSWSFGDGATGAGAGVTHAYGAGSFSPTLTVRDAAGGTWTSGVGSVSSSSPAVSNPGGGGTGSTVGAPAAGGPTPTPTALPTPSPAATPSETQPTPSPTSRFTSNHSLGIDGIGSLVLTVIGSGLATATAGFLFLAWRRRRLG